MIIIKQMRYIILGINDYIRDCWHDWLINRVNAYGGKVMDKATYSNNTRKWIEAFKWKEGNIFHYIKQRKYNK